MTSKQHRPKGKIVRYTAGEIGRVKVIDDVLPSPGALVARVSKKRHRPGKAKHAHHHVPRIGY